MDPVAFHIGPLPVRWYGILMSTALGLGTYLAYRRALLYRINPDHVLNLVLLAAPAGFVGARLYYVLFRWGYYAQNPREILAIWHGGLAIHGALLGGVAAGYYYVRRSGLDFWKLADIVAPSLILGQAIGRWGNFVNQEAHGGPVSQAFISRFPAFIQQGMLINGQYYHPTFLYESLWNLGVFAFLLWLTGRPFTRRGDVFLAYFGLYSVARLLIEGLRTDSLMLGPLRVAQLVSLAGIIIASALLWRRHRRPEAPLPGE